MEKSTVYLIVGNNVDLRKYKFEEGSFKVGIDHGSFICLNNGIKLDLAYGDFDSCTKEEFRLLEESRTNIQRVNSVKDTTDTEGALALVKDYKKKILLGAIQGKRPEHFLTNINLLKKNNGLVEEDDFTKIYKLQPSNEEQTILKGPYKFFSFYPVNQALITLKGFKYLLDSYQLKSDDTLCVSNQILGDEGQVLIKGGEVIVICTKDDSI